jgi:hypothetical protein
LAGVDEGDGGIDAGDDLGAALESATVGCRVRSSDALVFLQNETWFTGNGDLALVSLENGSEWASGRDALSILVGEVWVAAEGLEAVAVFHVVAFRTGGPLALAVDQLEVLRTAGSLADAVLEGEAFSAVLVAGAGDELVAWRAADSDALAVDQLVVGVALGAHAAGALLDRAGRAVLDRADAVDLLVAFWTGEGEALAVLEHGAGWAFGLPVADALVTFFLVAFGAVLEDAGAVLELEAL